MDIYGNEAYTIRRTLERMTDIQQEMLGVIKKPESPVKKVLEYGVLIAGVLGILHTTELVIRWIIGG